MGNEHEDLVKTLRQCSMLATILLSCWFVPRAHTALNSDERERKIHRCQRQVQVQTYPVWSPVSFSRK